MTLKEFYKKAVEIGIENDPRGKERVEHILSENRRRFEELPSGEKEYFDKDCLWNPYNDTRLYAEDPSAEVNNVMVGIDIEESEVMLFERLREKYLLDLLVSHHPEGKALVNFYEVMDLQVDILKKAGLSLSLAEGLIKERKEEVKRRISPANFNRTLDAAFLLKVPLICIHTPADNCVYQFLKKYLEENKPQKVKDIIELLLQIPEYKEAKKNNSGPWILNGSKDNRVEKIFLEMTGGTEGHKDIYTSLVKEGYDTIVSMHLSEEHYKKARDAKLNIIIAGHICSDTLGLNLLLDRIDPQNQMSFVNCSGFRRFRHNL